MATQIYKNQSGTIDLQSYSNSDPTKRLATVNRNSNVIVGESFENSFPPNGWTTVDSDGDGFGWEQSPSGFSVQEGSYCAVSASWDAANSVLLTPDNWLITYQLSVVSGDSVSWWVKPQDPLWPSEKYSVIVSTTGNSISDFTDTLHTELLSSISWQYYAYDLSSYAGMDIYIAFRHYDCSDNFYLNIDNIRLPQETPSSTATVTFEVNVNFVPNFNPATDTFFLAGDLPPVSAWDEPGSNPNLILSDNNSDGIYSITLELDTGNIEFKFFRGSSWDNGEWTGNPNRTKYIFTDVLISCVWGIIPPQLTVGFQKSDISCNGGNDGNIQALVTGGIPPYSYLWSNGSTIPAIDSLSAGNYGLTVTDASLSIVQTSCTITEPDPIVVIGDIVGVSSSGANDGAINIFVSGGAPPYSYFWPLAWDIFAQNVTTLQEGIHSVYVTDNNYCTEHVYFNVEVNTCNTLPYFEDFESGILPSSWTQETNATDGGWLVGDSASMSSLYFGIPTHTTFACTNDDGCNCDKSNDFLKTNCFDFSSASSVVLEFDYYYLAATYSGASELATLRISTSGGMSWVDLDILPGTASNWEKYQINLSQYAGLSNVMIAWHYYDGGGWLYGFALDNVRIYEPLDYDISIQEILLEDFLTVGSYDLKAVLVNEGITNISNVEMFYSINSGATSSFVASNLNIPFLGIDTVQYILPLNLQYAGIYNLTVGFANPNGYADQNPYNDTMSFVINVLDSISNRMVLIEHWTQASCGICVSQDSAMRNIIRDPVNIDRVAHIQYQTSWPGSDPMYDFNNAYGLADARVGYYGLIGVPSCIIAGNQVQGNPVVVTQQAIDNEYNRPGFANFSGTIDYEQSSDSLNIDLTLTPYIDFIGGDYTAHIILVEDMNYTVAPGISGETFFPDVMRMMFPDEDGSDVNGYTAFQSINLDFSWFVPSEIDMSNAHIVAFVQNNNNKEIIMASKFNINGQNSDTIIANFTANVTVGDVPLEVDFTDMSIGNPISWYWDFGDGFSSTDQNPNHIYQSPGNYSVSLIVLNLLNTDTLFMPNYIEVLDTIITYDPGWSFNISGTNHTVLIPNTIPMTINGVQIDAGDYIGVFYESAGVLACAGYLQWQNNNDAMVAWGDDTQTSFKDGFDVGEEFQWKIFDASENITYDMVAEFDLISWPNTSHFAVNGISGLLSLTYESGSFNWTYSISSISHSILIPTTANITIGGNPIQIGDYMGVFYVDDNGELACGGYQIYDGTNTALSAWFHDSYTTYKDGFYDGEAFTWKLFSTTLGMEYPAVATYESGFPNQGYFATNGMSGIASITASSSHEVVLLEGWNMISTYIDPFESLLDSVFADIVLNVNIIKDNYGSVYWPEFWFNNIGNHTIGEAYQVRMSQTDTLIVTGIMVIPEQTPIGLGAGWNMIAYLRQSPASIETMMQAIVSDIELIKDYQGQIYWPAWGVNLIGDMLPGQGYHTKMNNAATLTYPPNSTNISKSNIQIPKPKYFKTTINTGSNMTLGIPKITWETEPPIGSEIGVYNSDGLLVGSGVFTGKNLAISIWGNDEYSQKIDGMKENSMFSIVLMANGKEQNLHVDSWLEGDEFYKTNKISVVEKLSIINYQLSITKLFQNNPNPFSETTEIGFYLPEKAFVEIELFNLIGENIKTIHSQNLSSGNHTIVFERKNLPTGVYFYRLKSSDFSDTKIMNVE